MQYSMRSAKHGFSVNAAQSRRPRQGLCCAFASKTLCSKSVKIGDQNVEAGPVAAVPHTSRRHAVASMLLSRASVLLGSAAAMLASSNPPANAKVSIANVKKGGQDERDIEVTASGIRMSMVSAGRGEYPAPGSLVLVDVVGRLEDGTVFLDTRGAGGGPLAFQLGTTNKLVTEGLAQVVETMHGGDVKLAVVPADLGYGTAGVRFRSGAVVPPSQPLYYEVSLLRCQTFPVGLACCADPDWPCIKNPEQDIDFMGAGPVVGGAP